MLLVLAAVVASCSQSPSPREGNGGIEQAIREGALIVDVRTPAEFASGHYKGAVNIPLDELERRMHELGEDADRPIVLYCRTGRRSGIAQDIVRRAGYKKVYNGINQASLPCPTGSC